MIRAARYAYAALAWALVAAIVVQVLFIGLGLFASPDYRRLHVEFGWILHLAPLLVLVAAAAANVGRKQILVAVALVVLIWLVPILAAVRSTLPVAAAFHPLSAMVAFSLAIVVARSASPFGAPPEARPTTVVDWFLVGLVVVIVLFLSLSGSPEPT